MLDKLKHAKWVFADTEPARNMSKRLSKCLDSLKAVKRQFDDFEPATLLIEGVDKCLDRLKSHLRSVETTERWRLAFVKAIRGMDRDDEDDE